MYILMVLFSSFIIVSHVWAAEDTFVKLKEIVSINKYEEKIQKLDMYVKDINESDLQDIKKV